jgi:hypothetical protein
MKKYLALTLALLTTQSLWAYVPGSYNCGNYERGANGRQGNGRIQYFKENGKNTWRAILILGGASRIELTVVKNYSDYRDGFDYEYESWDQGMRKLKTIKGRAKKCTFHPGGLGE